MTENNNDTSTKHDDAACETFPNPGSAKEFLDAHACASPSRNITNPQFRFSNLSAVLEAVV
jgi:hypothetical protein